jgi:hypothetical protein
MRQGHAFTLNLRHDIEVLARSKPNPCQCVRDRMAAELRRGLGRSVDFIAAFEEADLFDEATGRWRPRFHVNGEMAVSVEDADACPRLSATCRWGMGHEPPAPS